MARSKKTLRKVQAALDVAVPAVEILGFVGMLKKQLTATKTDTKNTNEKRPMYTWAIILNIILRMVLVVAYIKKYKECDEIEPVYNVDCDFWSFCDEDCTECSYYKASKEVFGNETTEEQDDTQDAEETECDENKNNSSNVDWGYTHFGSDA